MSRKAIVECVPNFSEGRDPEKIEKIVDPFRRRRGSSCWTIKTIRTTIAWW